MALIFEWKRHFSSITAKELTWRRKNVYFLYCFFYFVSLYISMKIFGGIVIDCFFTRGCLLPIVKKKYEELDIERNGWRKENILSNWNFDIPFLFCISILRVKSAWTWLVKFLWQLSSKFQTTESTFLSILQICSCIYIIEKVEFREKYINLVLHAV